MILIPALFEGVGILSLFRIPIMITKEDIENAVWDSVWESVSWYSIRASVRSYVGDSVWKSVSWYSIRASVERSVGGSVNNSVAQELKERSL